MGKCPLPKGKKVLSKKQKKTGKRKQQLNRDNETTQITPTKNKGIKNFYRDIGSLQVYHKQQAMIFIVIFFSDLKKSISSRCTANQSTNIYLHPPHALMTIHINKFSRTELQTRPVP